MFSFDCEWLEESNDSVDILQLVSLQMVILIDIPALTKTQNGQSSLIHVVGQLCAPSLLSMSSPSVVIVVFTYKNIFKLSYCQTKKGTGGI